MAETMTAEIGQNPSSAAMNLRQAELEAVPEDGPLSARGKEIRRMQVRFERWLPVLISSRSGRVVKQLESSKAMAICRRFIAEFYDAIVEAHGQKSLSRFLSGEFTGGIVPIFVSKMVKGDVGDIVEADTIIEVMAEKFDAGEWEVEIPTLSEIPVSFDESVPKGEVVIVPQPTVDRVEEIAVDQARLDKKVSALPPPMTRKQGPRSGRR